MAIATIALSKKEVSALVSMRVVDNGAILLDHAKGDLGTNSVNKLVKTSMIVVNSRKPHLIRAKVPERP